MNMKDGDHNHVNEVSELKKLLSKHLSLSSSKKRTLMKSKRMTKMTTNKKNISKHMSKSRRNITHKND